MAALTLVEHQLATGDKSKVVRDNTRRFLWPPYGIGQAIIFSSCRLFCLLLSSFFVFLAYSQLSQIGCLPYFHTWCGLSANLGCRSESCCTRLAGNAEPKNSPKKSPYGHHRTTLSGHIFPTKAHIDNRKKIVKQQYLLHMSSQYGELRPSSGWDRLTSLGHPCKFQLVSRLCSVTARHLLVGVSQTLRRWTESATYIRQGDHHVGHWPTFLVCYSVKGVT